MLNLAGLVQSPDPTVLYCSLMGALGPLYNRSIFEALAPTTLIALRARTGPLQLWLWPSGYVHCPRASRTIGPLALPHPLPYQGLRLLTQSF